MALVCLPAVGFFMSRSKLAVHLYYVITNGARMTDKTDGELLSEFVRRGSSAAFTELVRRHMDWVYSCARRMLREEELSRDVAQAVFILLAGKAKGLSGQVHLGGWLLRATRYCAANALKQQHRRQKHEQEARIMRHAAGLSAGKMEENEAEGVDWEAIYPVLDEAVMGLGGADREAVLLRFYRGQTLAEVGAGLGISEEAAKKRVQRAVGKLRGFMTRRGVTVGVGGLAMVMAARVTQAAPAGLVEATVAVSAGTAKASVAGALAKAGGQLMWWAKAKVAALLVVGGVAGVVTGGVVVHAVVGQGEPMPIDAELVPGAAQVALTSNLAPAEEIPLPPINGGVYGDALSSGPGLSIQMGPNTFAVTAVVRFGGDGKPVATSGRGEVVDLATLPMEKVLPPKGINKDVVVVFLTPERTQYEIEQMMLCDHVSREPLKTYLVTQVPDVAALRIEAPPGTLPQQMDLWLKVMSYKAQYTKINLPAKWGKTVMPGGESVDIKEIREGSTTRPSRSGFDTKLLLQLFPMDNETAKWHLGFTRLMAVTKSGQNYFEPQAFDFGYGASPVLEFPFALNTIDHFVLAPEARQLPFYFDGIKLPTVIPLEGSQQIRQPKIVRPAKGVRTVKLPSGVVIEFSGIGYSTDEQEVWWGTNGEPITPEFKGTGNNYLTSGEYMNHSETRAGNFDTRITRKFVSRIVEGSEKCTGMVWQIMPSPTMYDTRLGRYDSYMIADINPKLPLTVRVGVAAPWETLEEFPVEQLPVTMQKWPGEILGLEEYVDRADRGVVIGRGVRVAAKLMWLPKNMRVVLVDQKGNAHAIGPGSYNSTRNLEPWGKTLFGGSCRDLKQAEVRSVRVEVRQEEYAEFEKVPLEPK